MAWTVHLIRRRPDRLPQISIVLLVIFALSVFLFRSFWLALLPVFVVLLSLSEYVFPIRYTLTNQCRTGAAWFNRIGNTLERRPSRLPHG